MSEWDRIRAHDRFTEEALKAQDGKRVPLRAYPGGPIIGEAVLQYDPESKSLGAGMRVDDPRFAEILEGFSPTVFSKESD